MKRILVSMALLALGACDQRAMEDSFNKSFASSANDACMKTAAQKGAPPAMAQGYCGCVVDEVTRWPLKEKMNFDPSSEKLKGVMTRCMETTKGGAAEARP